MAIAYDSCSDETMRICREALADVLGCQGIRDEHSLPAYVIQLEDCRADGGCEPALIRRTGWKYLAMDANGKALCCDVEEAPGAQQAEVDAVSEGVDAVRALQSLDELIELEEGVYEVRWVSVPGLLVSGFWLKSTTPGGPDLVAPLRVLQEELAAKQFFPLEEFIGIVRSMATERLAYNDAPN